MNKRPHHMTARKAIRDFLPEHADQRPELCVNGDGWAFWFLCDDTTSYVHHDLKIEWYGTALEAAP